MRFKKLLMILVVVMLVSGCNQPYASSPPTAFPPTPSAVPTRTVTDTGDPRQIAVEELDIERALAIYEQLAASESPAESLGAQLDLAWLDWRVFDQAEAAREHIAQIMDQYPDQTVPWILLAKLETESQDYDAAQRAAEHVLEVAQAPAEVEAGRMFWAWATVEQAVALRLAHSQYRSDQNASLEQEADSTQLEQLQQAWRWLQEYVEAEPGELRSSQMLLKAALLLGDGDSALQAWRSYYWVTAGEKAFGLLVEPYAVLQDVLPRWQGPDSPAEDRERLIDALVGSRFFEEAAVIALDPRVSGEQSPETQQLIAYVEFLHHLEDHMDQYYREYVTGRRNQRANTVFDQEVENFCQAICADPNTTGEALRLIRERFGARWHFRNNRFDLLMGHAIVEEEHTIAQYGQEATIDFTRLDALVSHGARSWLFDSLYMVGGWADRNQIVTYRPFRVELLLNLARPVLDPAARDAYENSVEQLRQQDDQRAAENPYAYLPGLNARLQQRSLESIWDEVGAQGLRGNEQRMRFLAELDEVWIDGPVFAHEGRHVLDFHLGITYNVELEFNAKLAETAFCRYPGIPLANNILHPNTGIHGHGEANLRIVQGLVAWMEAHADEVSGLDSARPLLPQLDLLTDEQLRTAACSLDPLANEN